MKKICIFLILAFFLNGCSVSLPKQESIKLPENISSPSVLVKKGQYISLLEMDGKVTNLTKTSVTVGFETFKTKSKFYFLTESFFFSNSLWVVDQTNKTLTCLIPRIKASNRIANFSITADELYFLYSTYISSTGVFDMSYDHYIYSFKDKKNVDIPISKDELVTDLKQTNAKNDFILVTQKNGLENSEQKEVFFWNIETKAKKQVATFVGKDFKFSQDYKWLVALENDSLVRYSLFDGKRDVCKSNITECQFDLVGTKPYLLVRDYRLSSPVVSYMAPDKTWNYLTFSAYDKIVFFENIGVSGVFLTTENDMTGKHKVVRWDPDQNNTEILFQAKNVDMIFDRTEDDGNIVEYKGSDTSTNENYFVVYNHKDGNVREFKNHMDFAYPISYDDSIWLFSQEDKDDKSKKLEFMIFDWKKNKEFKLSVDWSGAIFPVDASNDGQYIIFYCFGSITKPKVRNKSVLMNIRTGKEITIPKAGNFETITWVD